METFSKNLKAFFLLTLTKELIKNSAKGDILELQKIYELRRGEKAAIESEEPAFELEKREQPVIQIEPIFEQSILSSEKGDMQQPIQIKQIAKKPVPMTKPVQKQIIQIKPKPHLFIPELKLPPHLEYLKPIPTAGIDIDLFKLNPLVKDPAVTLIEVNPNERIIVTGRMGRKPTDIILSGEDVQGVINRFSEISRIPINEGIYRVVAGNLILSAIISKSADSKFVIKKMAYPNPYNMQGYPPSANNRSH